jgi:hypothetical protein
VGKGPTDEEKRGVRMYNKIIIINLLRVCGALVLPSSRFLILYCAYLCVSRGTLAGDDQENLMVHLADQGDPASKCALEP